MKNKRFIAGATCPQCQQLDKIYTYRDEADKAWRACVNCGFSESIDSVASPSELPTRVNQNRLGEKPLAHETPIEAVKLIDPKH